MDGREAYSIVDDDRGEMELDVEDAVTFNR